jgi:PAS domain S-box-containing protein
MNLRLGLTPRITLAFVLFACVVLACVGILSYRSGRIALESAAVSELLSASLAKETSINRWMAAQVSSIETLAQSPALLRAVDTMTSMDPRSKAGRAAYDSVVAEMRTRTQARPRTHALVAVADPRTGKIIAATDASLEGQYVGNNAYFLRGTFETHIENPFPSPTLHRPAIAISGPLHSSKGRVVAVLIGWIDVTELDAIVRQRSGLRHSDDAYLVNPAYEFVTQPRFITEAAVLKKTVRTLATERCLAGNSGIVFGTDYDAIPSIIAYRWLPERKLGLIMKISLDEALVLVREFGEQIILISMLVLAIASAAAVGLARTITRPIHTLQAGVTRFRKGQTDMQLQDNFGDEFGQLAAEFNKMAAAITEKEAQLHASNLQLEQRVQERTRVLQQQADLLELAHDAIIVHDIDGRVLYWNRGAEQMYGYSHGEALGQMSLSLLKTQFPLSEDAFNAALLKMGHWEGELIHSRRNGERFTVVSRQAMQRNEQGHPAVILEINSDITDRERAAQELVETEERTRLVLDTAYDAYIAIDAEDVITVWNQQAEAIFGWPRSEALGQRLSEMIIPERYREGHRRGLRHFWDTHEGRLSNKRVEFSALHRAGHEFPVEMTISPVRRGGTFFFSAFLRDITEQKRARQALQEATAAAETATRAKSEFLANMSHEIRTPMNAVIGLTELLLKTQLSQQQYEYMALIKSSADSLLRLLNDILDFSKMEARKLELDMVEFDLRESIGNTVKAFSAAANDKQLELAYRVDPDVPTTFLGDPGRLNQIIVNLTGNAIKFTRRGEIVVHVTLEPHDAPGAVLHVMVIDSGIGIPKQQQGQIFNTFAQADSSTTRQFGGTGLGLAIVSQLVALMQGRIWVDSEPGKGTTFHFTVRLDLPRRLLATLAPPTALRDVAVLVVDDNSTSRAILAETLSHAGMLPALAATGAKALEELHAAVALGKPYPLVLIDSHMPDFDGFQLAQSIRAIPAFECAAVMMLASNDVSADIERCEALGVTCFLNKPVKQSELFDALATATGLAPFGRINPADGLPGLSPRPSRILDVLVAEDHPINQKLLSVILNERGHNVSIASNGIEVLKILEHQSFDVILMDGQMPEMDGYQATAEIRRRDKASGKHTRIIAVTAHAMKQDREICLAAGMDDYVSKPIDPADLLERLEAGTDAAVASNLYLPEPNTASAKAFDFESALNRVRGKPTLLIYLVDAFLHDLPETLAEIDAAVTASDAAQVEQSAHRLKGVAMTLSAEPVAQAARKLEYLARDYDIAPMRAALDELLARAAELAIELKALTGTTVR